MGANQSGREHFQFGNKDVNFDHFHILRAIGKGSFGKVCIVQKKDSKQMFAMKYMNKAACAERDALRNVLREVELLTQLEHPFLVNIWFSFQDEEDLFMVSDLLLGGDLRYHIQHQVAFSKDSVLLMVYELGTALDYLHGKRIIHRDIKPDNILLDEEGHAHITDFNIATQLGDRELASSMSGTKPYMSPEIFDCAADACVGYSFPVDWWSLGVVAFEMVIGERPYDIHSQTGVAEVRQLFTASLRVPTVMDKMLADLIKRLLCVSPGGRCSSLEELKKTPAMSSLEYEKVFQKSYKPDFCPPKDHLNCDPTFELEEMIVETRPLHKKKKRLAKQKSIRDMQVGSMDLDSQNSPPLEPTMPNTIPEFITYNRYKELEKREMERIKLERQIKEEEWEKELATTMGENFTLEDKEESSRTGITQRTQDGCDILEIKDSHGSFLKALSEEGRYSDSKNCDKVKSTLKSNSVCSESGDPRRVKKLSDSEYECNPNDEQKTDNLESTSLKVSSKTDKAKYGSESDFLAIKKKHCKISFDLFNSKQKTQSSRSFSRASSLKINSVKEVIPENRDTSNKNESLSMVPDFSDNVKNRIAHSPKLKNSKMPHENQKASTFMDANYQKTKNEVMKSYQASLCSLKNDNQNS